LKCCAWRQILCIQPPVEVIKDKPVAPLSLRRHFSGAFR
jgi:hypothetical protein